METVTRGHVLIQKLLASVAALALYPHTCITDRTDPWSALVHWRNKQQPEFPVCYFRCLQNKMFIYIKPWLFLYPFSLTASPFFSLTFCLTILSSLHPQLHTSVIIKLSAGRSEAQHGKTVVMEDRVYTPTLSCCFSHICNKCLFGSFPAHSYLVAIFGFIQHFYAVFHLGVLQPSLMFNAVQSHMQFYKIW